MVLTGIGPDTDNEAAVLEYYPFEGLPLDDQGHLGTDIKDIRIIAKGWNYRYKL